MNPLIRTLLLSLMLALSLPACQSLSEREDARKLEHTLDSYGATVRWQPLDRMYAYLVPELQPDSLPDHLAKRRVTGYEVSVPPRKLADDKAVQTVQIEYVLVDRQVVRSLTDYQVWVRQGEEWLRANPVPDFK